MPREYLVLLPQTASDRYSVKYWTGIKWSGDYTNAMRFTSYNDALAVIAYTDEFSAHVIIEGGYDRR